MDQRPEQPPEGRLIADAADHMNLSIREAARRAGISYGRWRQIVTGYQNISPGSFAPVHAPAKTLARMAAVVGVTSDQMETQGQRPDAAEFMRQDVRPEPLLVAPVPRREAPPVNGSGEDPDLPRYRQQVLREVYEAIGLLPRLGPGELPRPDEMPGTEDALLGLPGALIFTADYQVLAWDNPRLSLWGKIDSIARARLVWDKATAEEQRRTGTALAAGGSPLVSVVSGASRASS